MYTLARWARERVEDEDTYGTDIILLGDSNVPKFNESDRVLKPLRQYGMIQADHSTQMGSNIADDAYYDHIAFSRSTHGQNQQQQAGRRV